MVQIEITAFRYMMPSRLVYMYRRIERARHLHIFKELHDVVDLNSLCHVQIIFTVSFFFFLRSLYFINFDIENYRDKQKSKENVNCHRR